ncbi:MAG TPA: ParB/Srx family N-terminal domain-containing protein, partial [Verrucomicrobiae bacterium]|nr:ParB/Srx family N-terminal domain-containing protein [Verrucomicrobiae bacterium]
MSTIHKTTNYNQFKLYSSNRELSEKSLVESIQQKNMLSSHPILVNKNLYVVDGQNRLKAAETLKLPIYYIIDENIDEEDIPRCQIQRAWELKDFLKFYKNHNENYCFINDMLEEYKLPIHFIVSCCTSHFNCHKSFRKGTYKIKKNRIDLINKFKNFYEIYLICKKICGLKTLTHTGMRAIWSIIQIENIEYDQNRMIK